MIAINNRRSFCAPPPMERAKQRVNIRDVIVAAIDASLAVETGDIEIAEDLQKTSAWLVALATASIYYAFSQIQTLPEPIDPLYLYGLVSIVVLLTVSFVAAYFVRISYTNFRALCRNLVLGKKILLSQLHEHADLVQQHLATMSTPLWVLVQSGQISKIFPPIADTPTADATNKQARTRHWLNIWFRMQRRTALLGLSILVITEAYSAYCKIYS